MYVGTIESLAKMTSLSPGRWSLVAGRVKLPESLLKRGSQDNLAKQVTVSHSQET